MVGYFHEGCGSGLGPGFLRSSEWNLSPHHDHYEKVPTHDDSTKDPMFWLWLSSTFASQHEDEQSAAAAVAATMKGKSYNKITNHRSRSIKEEACRMRMKHEF